MRLGQDLQSVRDSRPSPRLLARLAVGKHVTKAPLRTAKSGLPSEVFIQPSPAGPAAALPEQVRAEVTAVLGNRDQIRGSETLRNPHPIV